MGKGGKTLCWLDTAATAAAERAAVPSLALMRGREKERKWERE